MRHQCVSACAPQATMWKGVALCKRTLCLHWPLDTGSSCCESNSPNNNIKKKERKKTIPVAPYPVAVLHSTKLEMSKLNSCASRMSAIDSDKHCFYSPVPTSL